MSEFLCPITGELCLRPGKPVPGATTLSDNGYCGGEHLKDGVCPNILPYLKDGHLISEPNLDNLRLERKNKNTVYVYEICKEFGPDHEKLLVTVVKNGTEPTSAVALSLLSSHLNPPI